MGCCKAKITSVSKMTLYTIRMPTLLWRRVIADLRRRGNGWRESGAFLLGHQLPDEAHVSAYVCYDDIDPQAYRSGAIAFHASGYAALWQRCREKNTRVLADVHTHPGASVAQSDLDQRHPMLPLAGHTALIVPHFAQTPWWTLRSVGVHEYLGEFRWRAHPSTGRSARVKLSLW